MYRSRNTPTRRSDKSLRVYRRMLVQLFASTIGFVPSRRRRKSDHFNKSCRGDKDFHKNSPVRKKQFIKVSPRRVATTCHQECSTLKWHMRPTVFLNKDTTAPRRILCSCIQLEQFASIVGVYVRRVYFWKPVVSIRTQAVKLHKNFVHSSVKKKSIFGEILCSLSKMQ